MASPQERREAKPRSPHDCGARPQATTRRCGLDEERGSGLLSLAKERGHAGELDAVEQVGLRHAQQVHRHGATEQARAAVLRAGDHVGERRHVVLAS